MTTPSSNHSQPKRPTGRLSSRLSGKIPTSARLASQSSPFPLPLPSITTQQLAASVQVQTVQAHPLAKYGRRVVGFNTLARQFSTLALFTSLLALITLIIATSRLSDTADQFREISSNAAPSITAADDLGREVDTLDTHAADFLITSIISNTDQTVFVRLNETPAQAWKNYSLSLEDFNNTLFKAYSNVTYPGEAPTIRAITDGLENYTFEIGAMQEDIAKGRPEAALADYKLAHDYVIGNPGHSSLAANKGFTQEELLKQKSWSNFNISQTYQGLEANARKLYTINHNQLEDNYSNAQNDLAINQTLILFAAGLLVLVLFGLVVRYALVTHRALNPGFVPAFGIALVLLGLLVMYLGQAKNDFQTIASDSFESIDATSQTQQLLQDFNGDESRLLMNPPLLKLDLTNQALTPAVMQAFDGSVLQQNFTYKRQQILQLLKKSWQNVTYPEEPTALCQVSANPQPTIQLYHGACSSNKVYTLDTYFRQHDQIITHYNAGDLAQALMVSYGFSNDALAQANTSLSQLVRVNENYFDEASCNSIGQSEFNSMCSSAKTKAGLTVEEAGITNLHNNQTGYLDMLEGLSVAGFALLIVSTMSGIYLMRRLF